ncbi:MAG: (Fe-S)-binding protein [Chloroflexi bacterium]|nr:(Fe-S)-binding protein [Chloroflexota bacterium]
MATLAPYKEAAQIIEEEGGEALKLCYQCGLCTAVCPWNRVTSFTPRKLIHQAQLGLVDFEHDEVWRCVSCKLCVDRCPRGVRVMDIMRALRRVIVEVGAGITPDALRLSMKNTSGVGNPLGEEREKRTDWVKELGVKTFTKGTEILYFPCCYQIYDPFGKRVARAAVNIMKKAGVDFGMLGAEVSCCGESMRKAGSESIFQNLVQSNISAFAEAGVRKIVVTSPHCYHTFTEEYPEFGGDFEVIHFVQYLSELLREGKLEFTKKLNKKVTYHDSCCLGRYAGLYDEPRQVLESIPGLELVEMRENREHALCCGGCAGRFWMETKKGERWSDLRIAQAIEVEANVLAVACPYCMLNFQDSLLSPEWGDALELKDIAQLVEEAM